MIAAFWVRDTNTYSIAEHTSPTAGGGEHGVGSEVPLASQRSRDEMSDASTQKFGGPATECHSEVSAASFSGESVLAARVRWGVYLVLIAIAVGNMTGRLLSVNSVDKVQLEDYRFKREVANREKELTDEGVTGQDLQSRMAAETAQLRKKLRLQRPFLSANDRSRWMTIRSLVEHGTYAIDDVLAEPTWDTIDKVQHVGPDGQVHSYSSKPPLLSTILAGEYWVINHFSGATLRDRPYEIGRIMLLTINIIPLALMYVLLAKMVERLGTSDWGRIFVMAAATLGTLLNTFAIVLNNHIPAAVTAAIALYAAVRIVCDGERRLWWFALAGLAAALTAADDLPALTLSAFLGAILFFRAPRETLVAFVPGFLFVAVAFFATNWLAHHDLLPPYAHQDWYHYSGSYWDNRPGIDAGEPSRAVYALNVLVGHHGIFSLTPVWLLSAWGTVAWLLSGDRAKREIAALVAAITVVCLVFYIGVLGQHERNYGGWTSGFRWLFWCTPLWLVMMIPAADRLARSTAGQALAAVLLSFSVLSVSYPTWNPWTHPWIYNWFVWCGWPGF